MRQKMRLIEEIREMQSNLREIKMQKMKEKALNENNFGLLVEMTSNQVLFPIVNLLFLVFTLNCFKNINFCLS